MRRVLILGLITILGLAAGCGQAGTGPGGGAGGAGPAAYSPDDVVLRVEYLGGFVPVESLVTRLPIITVYGDGRVLSQGPVIDIFPSPALPNVLVQMISRAGVNELVDLALERGVGRGIDLGVPPVADAPSTRFTVLTNKGPLVSEAEALGIADEAGGNLTAEQKSARRDLQRLLQELTDLRQTIGGDVTGEEKPYQPSTMAAIARPWTDPGTTDIPAQPERAWPGPALPGAPINRPDLGCVLATGADLEPVLAGAAKANVLTPWTSAGKRWYVDFRPLLPEERSCADLTS